jgi:hypothetical protein
MQSLAGWEGVLLIAFIIVILVSLSVFYFYDGFLQTSLLHLFGVLSNPHFLPLLRISFVPIRPLQDACRMGMHQNLANQPPTRLRRLRCTRVRQIHHCYNATAASHLHILRLMLARSLQEGKRKQRLLPSSTAFL